MSVYTQGIVALMGVNILMALSVYAILSTDQVSLGNAGFMAIGAYTSAYLTVKAGWAIFPAIVTGALVASVMGLLVGIPVLRLSGLYIVMATFAFGEVVRTFFLNFEPTGGAYGFRGPIGTTLPMIYGWVLAFILFFWLLSYSRLGRSLAAVRDDPEVANSIGLSVKLLKLGAFWLGAFVAGVAGGLYAHYMFYIESNNFHILVSTMAILYVILGGMYTFWGAVVGAIIFSILPETLRFMQDWRMSLYGAVLVLMLIFRPSGIITPMMVRNVASRLTGIFRKAGV
ncbi:MAG: branched-chain amino acid ABC transporter permease [Desulfobacterales bacterium]|mgnify:FL=1|jgi:branched-chain amino acid transport system permease protein|nr:branched-chain amino acid ABC transporter permease [Desulfobacterales bacterium]MDP6808501.1 branched-chain amino acid ABC transporter permease [Desulfobacterales bacterium]|tara:strand:- start:36497 stop:37351 length:855 start_codon:yes stop_codon:yes gene_type:complete